jgi:ankyrin repeat protein
LILRGPVDIIEAVQYELTERLNAILVEDPGALNRAFSEYRLSPLDAEAWHTPLAYAVARGQGEIVRLLLERGADRNMRSPSGETLHEIAATAGHKEIVELLRAGNVS